MAPYGQLWRTGANMATKITFGGDVAIADKPVPAGTYALFTIPGKESWTVILNKNPNQAGTDSYKQDLDQPRFQARPQAAGPRERPTFLFSNTTEGGTSLDLEWERVRVSIPIKVNTDAIVADRIRSFEQGAWRPWNNAARYLVENKKDLELALRLVDRSLSLKEDGPNLWTKAQVLSAKDNPQEACAFAKRAKALGDKAGDGFFLAEEVEKGLAAWKCPP